MNDDAAVCARYRQKLIGIAAARISTACAEDSLDLDARNKRMDDEVVIQHFLPLFASVKGAHQVCLDLTGNRLGNPAVKALAVLLAQGNHKSLEVLCLGGNWLITDEGIIDICRVLPEACPLMKHLDFDLIRDIGDEAVEAIAEQMPKMKHLQSLTIGPGALTDDGCFVLASALPSCQSLQWVSIHDTHYVTNQGSLALLAGMRRSRTLKRLDGPDKYPKSVRLRLNGRGRTDISSENFRS